MATQNLAKLDRQSQNLSPKDRTSFSEAIESWQRHGPLPLLVNAGNNAAGFLYGDQKGVPHEPSDEPSLLNHFHHQPILDLYDRNQDKQLCCANGTARNEALTGDVDLFLNELGTSLVQQGVGHICGGAVSGAMGAAIKAWTQAIKKSALRDGVPEVEITTVLLKLFGEAAKREAPMELESYGESSVKQLTWLTRTPALHGIGRQDAMVFAPGGLGTLLEILFPLSASQHSTQGLAGIYDSYRKPSTLYCISSTEYRYEHFWAPMAQLEQRMREAGCSSVQGSDLRLLEPQKHTLAVRTIANEFRDRRELVASRPALTADQKEAAIRALTLLSLGGSHPRNLADSQHSFMTILDNTISAHRTLFHLRTYMELYSARGRYEAENYLEDNVSHSAEERENCLNTLARLAKKPAARFVGSTREHIWNKNIEQYSKEVINLAVESGYTIVVDGLGTEGMAKRWTDMWVAAKRAFAVQNNRESESELVRVQVAFPGRESAKRTLAHGYEEVVLPTVLNFETRNELAACVGSKQAIIVAPGGQTAAFAAAQAILNMQLLKKMHTPYPKMPEIQILNAPLKEDGPRFYGDLQRQLQSMKQHEMLSPRDYNDEWFVHLEDPKGDAKKLMNSLRSQ